MATRRRQTNQTQKDAVLTPTSPKARRRQSSVVGDRVHALPIHTRVISSPLSPDAPGQTYQGFHNLFLLLFVSYHLRLMIENGLKYGFLLPVTGDFEWPWGEIAVMSAWMAVLPLSVTIAWAIEANAWRQQSFGMSLSLPHWLNIACVLCLPNYYGYYYMENPLLTAVPCFTSVILTLKLCSWVWVNRELRQAHFEKKPIEVYGKDAAYPKNLTFYNMFYFTCAPTLCYQPSYPRTARFRKVFFLKRLTELVFILVLMLFLAVQYSRPILNNALKPFSTLHWVQLLERLLKLSLPSIYMWLMMFYGVFHSALNLLAEVMHFGDRSFYKPWWNAQTIGEYWRLWNLPIYQWFKRHVYLPMRASERFSVFAQPLAFFISAIGHELVVGIPMHSVVGWAFWAMMAQVPLVWVSERIHRLELEYYRWRQNRDQLMADSSTSAIKGSDDVSLSSDGVMVPQVAEESPVMVRPIESRLGNYLFWISFCLLGQPVCLLLYYRSWYLKHYGNASLP